MGGRSQDYKAGLEEIKSWSLNFADKFPKAGKPMLRNKEILNMAAKTYIIYPRHEILKHGHE